MGHFLAQFIYVDTVGFSLSRTVGTYLVRIQYFYYIIQVPYNCPYGYNN